MAALRLLVILLACACVAALLVSDASASKVRPAPSPSLPTTNTCPMGATQLCIPLDNTFTIVPFNGLCFLGGVPGSCARNDDDALEIPLPFTFHLLGGSFTSCFVDNNGFLSFGDPFCAVNLPPQDFPLSPMPMVAPFWADVSTEIPGSGVVYFRVDAHKLVVTWDHVSYYAASNSLSNTFQVMISDGLDPDVGIGNNVCFCYDDMQWSTGGNDEFASGGFGIPGATVGINRGDGVHAIQVGRFSHEGTDSDGPYGADDGVSFLDHRRLCFDVADVATPTIHRTWSRVKAIYR